MECDTVYRSVKKIFFITTATVLVATRAALAQSSAAGLASWYGEEHRGKPMANGKLFDPDKLTAASWFYPLGAKVHVRLETAGHQPRSVLVTITDRGPDRDLVRAGRVIDLSRAAFKRLAPEGQGLAVVSVGKGK